MKLALTDRQMEIKIGQIGQILAGDEVGAYVKIMDDAENSGGYLILTAMKRDMLNSFDNWVESREDLFRYFVESRWFVQWL
jgi:hypothetical protein